MGCSGVDRRNPTVRDRSRGVIDSQSDGWPVSRLFTRIEFLGIVDFKRSFSETT
jgi:hypothetical protein